MPLDPNEPLTWDMNHPVTGEPLCWDEIPGLTWDSTVGDLLAALAKQNTPMNEENRISYVIPADDLTAISGAFTMLETKLTFLVSLTDEDRLFLIKLGERDVAFTQKCAAHMAAHPELVPAFVNVPELAKDRSLRDQIEDFLRRARQLVEGLEDTLALLNHEIRLPELAFYQNVRYAAQHRVPGAEVIYNDLKPHFPGPTKKKTTPTPPPA